MDTRKDTPAPAQKVRHEPLWPTYVAIASIVILSLTLPERLIAGPTWLAPAIEVALLVPVVVLVPDQYVERRIFWRRLLAIALIAVINAANIASLALLVHELLYNSKINGAQLIIEAMKLWLENVLIFALWYWELDRGGPARRWKEWEQLYPDFLFPQMGAKDIAPPDWRPTFVDYLYISFTNATAFSPTDTLPLTHWAKMLMLAQSLISLLTVALVAARAVNILGQ